MRLHKRWWLVYAWLGLSMLIGSVSAQEGTLEERVEQLEKAFAVSENTFRVFWKNGLRLQTLDKKIEIRIGGRINLDWNFTFESDELDDALDASLFGGSQSNRPEDQIFFRRARIFIRGTLYKIFEFKAEYDFTDEDVDFNDVYIGLKKIPYLGVFRVGRFKQPFGLENKTSSRFVTFQERSMATEAFISPSRQFGFYAGNTLFDKRMTWAASVARTGESSSDAFDIQGADDDYNITIRLTGVPWIVEKGQRVVHLGVSYAFNNYIDSGVDLDNVARFRARPEARIGAGQGLRFVDTDEFGAESGHVFGFEGAVVYGPLSVQGEVILATWFDAVGQIGEGDDALLFDEDEIEDATLFGYYIFISYFLTGERRPYSTSGGNFGRPKPKRNFDLKGGLGAWEIAFRLSGIDLDDAEDFAVGGDPRDGGKEYNLTFGLNWYPNPNTRVTLNYIYGVVDDRSSPDGVIDINDDDFSVISMRMYVDF